MWHVLTQQDGVCWALGQETGTMIEQRKLAGEAEVSRGGEWEKGRGR